MSKFKNFLQEMIQFNYGIHFVDSEGEDKTLTVKATTQNDALNKFKANDKVKGYKNILQVRKGDPVPPSET